MAVFDADTLCHAVNSRFSRWPWKFVVGLHQESRDQKSVRNLSEIEQSAAELFIILRIFAHVMTFDLLTTNF